MITEQRHSQHFESSLHISDFSVFKNHRRSIIYPNSRVYKHCPFHNFHYHCHQKEQHKSLDLFQLDKCKLLDPGTFVYTD